MKSLLLVTTLLSSSTGALINKNTNHINLAIETNTILEQLTGSYKNKDIKSEQISYFNYLSTIQNSKILISLQNNINVNLDLKKFKDYSFYNPNIWTEHTSYNYQQAENQYKVALNYAITNIFNKILILSMVSDITNYYKNSDNINKNEIIKNNINIIKDLTSDINHESDSEFEHSLFNKQGTFMTSISNFNLNQLVTDYQNGKTDVQLEKYRTINYNTNNFTVDSTPLLKQLMSDTFNEAASHLGLETYATKAGSNTINLNDFNINLSFNVKVYFSIFSPPTPWGERPQAPQVDFRTVMPSLFDISLI
ncbi:hypothetical protein [Spiroplasma endosymbiont of Nebria brevicollis]|uniref:hypothetical protein n=1 Tax=Spiroplasma endosymbiont of Nebria brevicollis TaxID=3066284 RepID=UPI00313CCBBD